MLFRVSWIDYETGNDDSPVARIACRGSDGERHLIRVHGTRPYFYVPENETPTEKASEHIEEFEYGYESIFDDPLKRVYIDHPKSNARRGPNIKKEFDQSFEADVLYYRRLSIDGLCGHIEIPDRRVPDEDREYSVSAKHLNKKPKVSVEDEVDPRVMIGDIEVYPDTSVSFTEMKEDGDQPVIAISLWDSYDDEYFELVLDEERETDPSQVKAELEEHWEDSGMEEYIDSDITLNLYDSETNLLSDFIDIVNDKEPDAIGGWNFTDFDWEYLCRRIRRLKGLSIYDLSPFDDFTHRQIEPNNERREQAKAVPGLPGFDMMEALTGTIIFSGVRSKALDYISQDKLGVGKVEGISAGKEYDQNRSRLTAYNLIDTQLCVALDRQEDIFGFFYELSSLCSIPIYDAHVPMRRVDGYILSRTDDDEILPNQEKKDLDQSAGAFVFEPPNDILDWIGVLDLKSLYPSVIITFNISPETVVTDTEKADLTVPGMPAPDDVEGRVTEEEIAWSGENVVGTTLEKEGVIPKYLRPLFPERAEKKTLRNDHDPDSALYNRYDNQQYALKVLMNCFSGDTTVWTPRGPKNIKSLEIGDEVYSINPETKELEVKDIIKTVESPNLYGELQHIEGQDIDLRITENHRMLTEDEGFIEYSESMKTPSKTFNIPDHGKKDGDKPEHFDLVDRRWIDEGRIWIDYEEHGKTFRSSLPEEVSKNVELNKGRGEYKLEDFEIYREHSDEIHAKSSSVGIQHSSKHSTRPVRYEAEDWLELIGWYVSEGMGFEDPRTNARRVTICQKNEDGRSQIRELLDRMDINHAEDVNGFTFSTTCLYRTFTQLCGNGSGEKKLPEFIFDLDSEYLDILWSALMEGDGSNHKGHIRYSTKSEQLKNDVCRLLIHRGYQPQVRRDTGVWRIRPSDSLSFRDKRNRESESHDGNVYCVTVEDNHTLLAGRNGKYCWTGQTFFGVSGTPYWRLAAYHLGDMITGGARYVIWKSAEVVESMGYPVLYSDTDSAMLELGNGADEVEELLERGFEIEDELNERMTEVADSIGVGETHPFLSGGELHGTSRHCISFEFEKLYRKYLQAGKKKRYAGHIVWKEGKEVDKVDITGFESKRSDSPEKAAEIQEEVIEGILFDEGFDAVSEAVRDGIDALREDFDTKTNGKPGAFNPPYEKNEPVLRACNFSNKHLGYNWEPGDQPWLVYVSSTPPGMPETDIIAIEWTDDVPDGFTINYGRMIEKNFEQPLSVILDLTDWSFKDLKTGKTAGGLADW